MDVNEIKKWADDAVKIRQKIKDEAYEKTSELVKAYGEETEDCYVFEFKEGDQPTVVDYESGFDGDYDSRYIEKIELDKKYGGLSLIYGESEYEYMKYSDVSFSDRLYIIDEILNLVM